MDCLHKQLFDALERMDKMHEMMMEKVNHGASFYDAECLHEMNGAPIQAAKAMAEYRQALPPTIRPKEYHCGDPYCGDCPMTLPNGEVRGASRNGEASSAEGATSTVVLAGMPGRKGRK